MCNHDKKRKFILFCILYFIISRLLIPISYNTFGQIIPKKLIFILMMHYINVKIQMCRNLCFTIFIKKHRHMLKNVILSLIALLILRKKKLRFSVIFLNIMRCLLKHISALLCNMPQVNFIDVFDLYITNL